MEKAAKAERSDESDKFTLLAPFQRLFLKMICNFATQLMSQML